MLSKANTTQENLSLKILVKQEKNVVKNLQVRENELKSYISELRGYIELMEHDSNTGVIDVLEKYEKYKNVLSIMIKKHSKDLKEADDEFAITKKEISEDLKMYESRLNVLNKELHSARSLLKVLATYKNQEYPEKLLKIKSLRKQMTDLIDLNSVEKDDFQKIVSMERERIINMNYNNEKNSVTGILDEEIEKKFGTSLQSMAQSNQSLKNEIDIYLKIKSFLEEDINNLKSETKKLLENEKWNFKKVVYPEFYKYKERCTPDQDVIIEYKTKQWNKIMR